MMSRGFIGGLFVAVMAIVAAGIVVAVLVQGLNSTSAPPSSSGRDQEIPVTLIYSANKTEFPSGIFKIRDGSTVLGADYIRAKNKSEIIYTILGASAGAPLAVQCHWVVNATIMITNPILDTTSYADLSPMPTVVVANVSKILSYEEPQKVCTTP